MGRFQNKVSVEISGSICLIGALSLLILPLKWVIAAVFAAIFHELCHVLAVWLCGSRIRKIGIGASGAVMECAPMGRGRELICALAGPVGGLCLLLLVKWVPRIALCAAFQSAYNLLPVYPMDGGRALRCGAAILLPPPVADKVCGWTESAIKVLLWSAGIYFCCILKLGILPLILVILLSVRSKPEKVLAKIAARRYNSPTMAKRYDYDGFTKQDPPHGAETCPIYRGRI